MHKFDEKTYATLEITNAVGTSTAKFSLLPPASSMGVIIGVIVVTIIIILGIFIFTLTKVNKALCFKDQQSGVSESGKKSEDPEAQNLAPKEEEEKEKSTSKEKVSAEKVTEWKKKWKDYIYILGTQLKDEHWLFVGCSFIGSDWFSI